MPNCYAFRFTSEANLSIQLILLSRMKVVVGGLVPDLWATKTPSRNEFI